MAEEFVTDIAITAHRLKIWPVGTLLVAMYGEGKTRGQVTELGIAATINQACAAIVVDEEKALSSFVKLTLQANYMEMRDLAEGGNQPNLNLSKIKEFPLRLPPIDEQHEIVRRVETLFALADRIEARYQAISGRVDKLTHSLLAKAFRGELVPQDPNDEPASVLLERIRAVNAATAEKPKGRARRTVIQKPEVKMLKLNQIARDHLTAILRQQKDRRLEAKELWRASQLDIPDFYEQLKNESEAGLLREVKQETRSFLETA